MAAKALEISGVTMRFGGVVALSQVTLDVEPGQIRALIGPNGSGKSTLINVVTGIYRPNEGTVKVDGRDITHLKRFERAELGVGRTFQNLRYARHMTARENVLIGMHHDLPGGFWSSGFKPAKVRAAEAEARERADRLLERVGLRHRRDTLAASLAHGEVKRLELARALAGSPRVLLLDEPVAGLGDAERTELMDIVRSVVADGGTGVLLVEHSMRTTMAVSNRVTVLDHGVIIAEGTPAEVQENEKVIAAYLGERVKR